MPTFEYKTTTSDGTPTTGRISAADEAAARDELRRQGIDVQSIEPFAETPSAERLTAEEATVLVEHLSAAADAGLPLVATLQTIAEDAEQPRLSRAARHVAKALDRGVPLDQALQSLGRSLPRHVQATVRAGIQSGQLAEAFHQFGVQSLQARALKSLAWQSIAYPGAVLLVFALLALLFCYAVVPQFAEMFDEFELDLPVMTEVVVDVSSVMPIVILITVGSIVATAVAIFFGGRLGIHRVLGALPVVGGLWTAYSQWEFASTLANFISLRLPLADALQFTSEAVANRYLSRACEKVRLRTIDGVSLAQALAESKAFDRALPAAADWGTDHQRLADVLRLAGEVYSERLQSRAAFVRRVLPTATLIIIGACVVTAILALFLPLVNLIGYLSG